MAESENKFLNKRQSDSFTLSFVILLVLLVLFSILLSPLSENILNKNLKFLFMLLPFFSSLVLFLLLNLKFKLIKNTKNIITSNSKISYKKILLSFSIWFIFLSLILIINILVDKKSFQFQFNLYEFVELFFISIIFVSIQSFFEELLFRRFLILSLDSYIKNKWILLSLSSILFSMMHLNNPEIKYLGFFALIFYFASGFLLSIISYFDKGIELSTGFHIANNLFGTLILTNKWQVFQTNALIVDNSYPKISWDIWFILLILYPFCLFLYFKIYKSKLV